MWGSVKAPPEDGSGRFDQGFIIQVVDPGRTQSASAGCHRRVARGHQDQGYVSSRPDQDGMARYFGAVEKERLSNPARQLAIGERHLLLQGGEEDRLRLAREFDAELPAGSGHQLECVHGTSKARLRVPERSADGSGQVLGGVRVDHSPPIFLDQTVRKQRARIRSTRRDLRYLAEHHIHRRWSLSGWEASPRQLRVTARAGTEPVRGSGRQGTSPREILDLPTVCARISP
jgi:hypothetical protein